MAAVQENGRALEFASRDLRNDTRVVLAAVRTSGSALEYAAPELQGLDEIVQAATQENVWALRFAASHLTLNLDVSVKAVAGHNLRAQYQCMRLCAPYFE